MSIYPDRNSSQREQITTWVAGIPVGSFDVVNDVAVARTQQGYYVQGRKKPVAWNQAVELLLRSRSKNP